ncbi:MAG TPA: carboxypeptidase-like regulatory domain-containing protein [Terriglobales bacterium]|nr:carboxypeptidase-like regulatory domain-containing protein [Terriglobales bacterium]
MRRFETLPSLFLVVLGLALLPADLAGQNPSPAEPQKSTGGFRIAGKVVNALVGTPLARARVTIVDTKNQQKTESTVTSEGGSFEFLGLAAGKYELNGAKRGFISAAYEQHERYSTAIVTGAGLDTEHLVLRLAPDALLMGTVLDESGEPVRRATVSLYREDRQAGEERIRKVRTEITDDQGSYEFFPLDSGTYFVSAVATPWYAVHRSRTDQRLGRPAVDPSLDVAYPEAYYKDATEPDAASPIPIQGGDRLEADIHLNPVPALHLILRWGNRDQYYSATLQRPAFGGMDSVPNEEWQTAFAGESEIAGIAPGAYTVRVREMGPDGKNSTVDLNLELKDDWQEIDASRAEPASKLKASLRIVGGEKLPQPLSVGLRNSKLRVVAWQEVNSKGEVELDDVAAGKYEVLIQAPQRTYSLVHISSGDAETAGDTINVAAGRSLDVSLLVAAGTTNVEGVAERNGQPVAGAMVVLVPKDPESNRSLFRRDQSDLDGSFSLANVIPGSYAILAIDHGWDLDWASPTVIRAYSQHAKTIRVGDSQGSMHLPDAVEVQGR